MEATLLRDKKFPHPFGYNQKTFLHGGWGGRSLVRCAWILVDCAWIGGFHKWSPSLGTKEPRSLLCSFWIRLRGLPLHLWNEDSFHYIANKCGGLRQIDESSLSRTGFRWARILLNWTVFKNILRCVAIFYGTSIYQVIVEVEDGWSLSPVSAEGEGNKPQSWKRPNHRVRSLEHRRNQCPGLVTVSVQLWMVLKGKTCPFPKD